MNTNDANQLKLFAPAPEPMTAIIHKHENNDQSQKILDDNRPRFTKQCVAIYRHLMAGNILTTTSALQGIPGPDGIIVIGDLRARMRDLRKNLVKFHDPVRDDRFKTWFMDTNDVEINKINFPFLQLA